MANYPMTPQTSPDPEQSVELRNEEFREYLKDLAVQLANVAFVEPGRTLCLECSSTFKGEGKTGYCPLCARKIFMEDE